MTTTTTTTPETIRLDMTWQAAARIFCMVLTDGSPDGQRSAEAEILRMASQADRVREMAESQAAAKAEARAARSTADQLAAKLATLRETLAGVLDSFDQCQGAIPPGQIDAARVTLWAVGTGPTAEAD